MPVFTQIISAEPVTESTVILATCTCACLSEDDFVFDSTEDSSFTRGLYIRIDSVIHWSTCALYANALSNQHAFNDNSNNNSKNSFSLSLLKQQQQQQQLKVIGGLAVLKRPPPSSLSFKSDPFAPRRLPSTRTGHLYPGSRFRGKQKSGNFSYDVMVDIKVSFFLFSCHVESCLLVSS